MAGSRDDGIKRRDFLNGMLIAAGGAAVAGSMPFRAFGSGSLPGAGECDGGIGTDPRVLRGGNLEQVFTIAHWLRDGRLSFGQNTVTLAKGACDNNHGSFTIHDDSNAEVIVVGSGMSGLSAAYFLQRQRPGTKVLVLDGQATPGGNANRDDAPPIPDIASTATAYSVPPYNDFLTDIYGTVGINTDDHIVQSPFYCYWFDNNTPYVLPGTNGWNLDTYGTGLGSMPYSKSILHDFNAARNDLLNWYNTTGSPTDPADNSDPQFDYLSPMSFDYYLTQVKGYHPAVSDFYTRYAVDALTGTTAQTSAYTSISFLGAEYNPLFAYPGGNSGVLRHILKWLIPASIPGSSDAAIINNAINLAACDNPNNTVRVRQGAMVLRGDTGSSSASVVYFKDGQFYRATAKAVIFAGQGHTARTACAQLFSPAQAAAYDKVVLAPTVTANVTLKNARALVQLGLGYDQYYWGSTYWADFVVADWLNGNTADPNRPVVLTFYGGNDKPPEQMPSERLKLLSTPFSAYERSLKDDLNRVLAPACFDYDRDVAAVYLYRWGHSLVYPFPGWPFAAPTVHGSHVTRNPSPRALARQQVGRISFAGQDVESSPATESAIGSGFRTAGEVIPLL